MQSVGREHAAPGLRAHERKDVDVRPAGALDLLTRDLVEPLDGRGDLVTSAEGDGSGRERPVGLGERVTRGVRSGVAHAPMDHAQLIAIPSLVRSRDDVVRADEHGDQRGSELIQQRQLLADEIVRRVPVHRGIAQDDGASGSAPHGDEDGGE